MVLAGFKDLLLSYCFFFCWIAADSRDELRKLYHTDKLYGRLHRRLVETSRSIDALATRLRITPNSSRGRVYALDPAATSPKPWESA
jgi:hypothetical protein